LENGPGCLDPADDLLKNSLVQFSSGFEILPGTGAEDPTPEASPFEQGPLAVNAITD